MQARIKKDPSARALEKEKGKGSEKGTEKGSGKGMEKGLPDKKKEKEEPVDEAAVEEFMTTLPTDGFADEEVPLRQALLDYLDLNEDRGDPKDGVFLNDAKKDPAVRECIKIFPPRHIPLRSWIDFRVGGELNVRRGRDGVWIMERQSVAQERKDADDAKKEEREAKFQDWLACLPTDGFEPLETSLRDAIMKFLKAIPNNKAALYDDACKDPEVQPLKQQFLPKGHPASLRQWIENRIGGEVEIMKDDRDGKMLIGFTGKLEAQMNARILGSKDGGVHRVKPAKPGSFGSVSPLGKRDFGKAAGKTDAKGESVAKRLRRR